MHLDDCTAQAGKRRISGERESAERRAARAESQGLFDATGGPRVERAGAEAKLRGSNKLFMAFAAERARVQSSTSPPRAFSLIFPTCTCSFGLAAKRRALLLPCDAATSGMHRAFAATIAMHAECRQDTRQKGPIICPVPRAPLDTGAYSSCVSPRSGTRSGYNTLLEWDAPRRAGQSGCLHRVLSLISESYLPQIWGLYASKGRKQAFYPQFFLFFFSRPFSLAALDLGKKMSIALGR